MRILILVSILVLIFVIPLPLYAQAKLGATVGITNSINMGELGPAPIFKGIFSTGGRLRLESVTEFSPIDKYTKAGWYVKNGINILVFPSSSSFFISTGMDYKHRNSGLWAKDGIRIGVGTGYDNGAGHYEFSVKDKIVSLNDDIKYYPYFEFIVRNDYRLVNSKWCFRTEAEMGIFKYIQNNIKRGAFYIDANLGFVYRWP